MWPESLVFSLAAGALLVSLLVIVADWLSGLAASFLSDGEGGSVD